MHDRGWGEGKAGLAAVTYIVRKEGSLNGMKGRARKEKDRAIAIYEG